MSDSIREKKRKKKVENVIIFFIVRGKSATSINQIQKNGTVRLSKNYNFNFFLKKKIHFKKCTSPRSLQSADRDRRAFCIFFSYINF